MRHFPETITIAPAPFSMARVIDYGRVTNDLNPLHVDADFAAGTRFGKPIVHGLFVLAPVWEAFEQVFGAAGMAGARTEIRFVAPTFVETTPVYTARLEGVEDDGAGYMVEVSDAAGTLAVKALVIVPAEPA